MYTKRYLGWLALLAKPITCTSIAVGFSLVLLSGCSTDDGQQKTAAKATEAAHSEDDGHNHGPNDQQDHSADDGHDHGSEETGSDVVPPGTVAITPQVRQNLGITLATVEMRRVASTMRVPGKFEPLPSAVREYHAPLAGQIQLLVSQYEHVTTGTPLYRLDSPEWRKMQQELISAHAEVMSTSASLMMALTAQAGGASAGEVRRQRIASSEAHIKNLQQSIEVAEERLRQVQKLQSVMGGKLSELNEARSQVTSLRSELSQAREDRAELDQQQIQLATEGQPGAFGTTATMQASLLARRAEYESAKAQRDLLFANLAAILGRDNVKATSTAENWTLIPEVEIKATAEGTVSELSISTGAYVEIAAPILKTLNTDRMRFRALALQSDVQRLGGEMSGRILKPGTADGTDQYIPVTVIPGLEADAEERTLDLVAEVDAMYPWAKVGLSTDLELVLDDTEDPEPAIPVEAVIQDGLDKVFFRQNPSNPNQAVRIKADLGLSDGHWIVVNSGVKAGDKVVLDGVYELKLATADVPEKAGHFHADGTFHDGQH